MFEWLHKVVVLSITTELFFLQQKKKLKWVKSYNKQEGWLHEVLRFNEVGGGEK